MQHDILNMVKNEKFSTDSLYNMLNKTNKETFNNQQFHSLLKNIEDEFFIAKHQTEFNDINNGEKYNSLLSEIYLGAIMKSKTDEIEFEKDLPNSNKDVDIYLPNEDIYIEVLTPKGKEIKSRHKMDSGDDICHFGSPTKGYISRRVIGNKVKINDKKGIESYFVAIDVRQNLKIKTELFILENGNNISNTVYKKYNLLDGIILFDSSIGYFGDIDIYKNYRISLLSSNKNSLKKCKQMADLLKLKEIDNQPPYLEREHRVAYTNPNYNFIPRLPKTITIRKVNGEWEVTQTKSSFSLTKYDTFREAINKAKDIRRSVPRFGLEPIALYRNGKINPIINSLSEEYINKLESIYKKE